MNVASSAPDPQDLRNALRDADRGASLEWAKVAAVLAQQVRHLEDQLAMS